MRRCSVSFPGKELGDAPPTALGVLGKLVFPTQGPLPAHPALPPAPSSLAGLGRTVLLLKTAFNAQLHENGTSEQGLLCVPVP